MYDYYHYFKSQCCVFHLDTYLMEKVWAVLSQTCVFPAGCDISCEVTSNGNIACAQEFKQSMEMLCQEFQEEALAFPSLQKLAVLKIRGQIHCKSIENFRSLNLPASLTSMVTFRDVADQVKVMSMSRSLCPCPCPKRCACKVKTESQFTIALEHCKHNQFVQSVCNNMTET